MCPTPPVPFYLLSVVALSLSLSLGRDSSGRLAAKNSATTGELERGAADATNTGDGACDQKGRHGVVWKSNSYFGL